MACDGTFDTNSLQPWARVPGGSTLELAVESMGHGVVAGARVLTDHPDGTTAETLWKDPLLRPGPVSLALTGDTKYTIRVRVGFTAPGDEEAVIVARISRPDGTRHGQPYRYCVHGTTGDVGRSTITIATRSA